MKGNNSTAAAMMARLIMHAFILLAIAPSVVSASFVATRVFSQNDMGSNAFEQLTFSIAVDCSSSQVKVWVMDDDNLPVEGATTYLQYAETGNQLISTIETPENGITIHQLPGNTSYMRSTWSLYIEKDNYRGKMVQFDLAPCFSDWVPTIYYAPVKNTTTPADYSDGGDYNYSGQANETNEDMDDGSQEGDGQNNSNAAIVPAFYFSLPQFPQIALPAIPEIPSLDFSWVDWTLPVGAAVALVLMLLIMGAVRSLRLAVRKARPIAPSPNMYWRKRRKVAR